MRIPPLSRAPLAQGTRIAARGPMSAPRLTGLFLAGLFLSGLFLAGCGGGESSGADSKAADGTDQTGLDAGADTGSDAAAGAGNRGSLPAEAASTTAAPAPAPPPEAPMPPQPLPGTDAVIVSQQAGPAAADPRFDARAFAGTYSGGTTRLDIGADGQFALDESGQALTGTWTLQTGGKTIVLDPDAKGDTDRLLQLEPDGSVRIAGGATLRRQ